MRRWIPVIALTIFAGLLIAFALWVSTLPQIYQLGSVWDPDNPSGEHPMEPWSKEAIRINAKVLRFSAAFAVMGLLCLVGSVTLVLRRRER